MPTTDSAKDVRKPGRGWRTRLWRGLILYVVVPYLAVTVIFALFQHSLIYRSVRSLPLPATVANFDPHSAEDVTVAATDGIDLHGWLIRSKDAPPEPGRRRLVVYFPGNSGHREMRRRDLIEIASFGFDVLIVDYRGYAENGGWPTENRLARDAHAVWEAATQNLAYAPSDIVVFGESLGGAVAIRLCAELGEKGPDNLVVTSTFNSLSDVVGWTYPTFPFRYLLWDRFDSASRFGRVRSNVVVIHGDEDEFVPVELGRRLFDSAPDSSAAGRAKRWEMVAGMGHNDVPIPLLSSILQRIAEDTSSHSTATASPLPEGRFIGESAPVLPMR